MDTGLAQYLQCIPGGISEFESRYARLTELGTQFARLSEFDTLTANCSISDVSSHFLSFHPFSLFFFFSRAPEMTKLPLRYTVLSRSQRIAADPLGVAATRWPGGSPPVGGRCGALRERPSPALGWERGLPLPPLLLATESAVPWVWAPVSLASRESEDKRQG